MHELLYNYINYYEYKPKKHDVYLYHIIDIALYETWAILGSAIYTNINIIYPHQIS